MLQILNAIRQHHALEHATIHLVSRRNPAARLVGRTTLSGFVIYGAVGTEDLLDAATEALFRLQNGEAHLAVHPRCGTNLVVTGVLSGLAGFAAGSGPSRTRLARLPVALTVAALAAVVAQPVAHAIQERVTTSPLVAGLRVAEVARQEQGPFISHHIRVARG